MAKVLWRSRAGSAMLMWFMIATFTVTLGGIVIANAYVSDTTEKLGTGGWLTLLLSLGFALIVSVWSTRASIEVDVEEFRVRFGLGWPVRRIVWANVEKVEYVDVRPMEWGGWGYKVNLAKHSSAVVVRAGEGLKLTLANGRVFVVTVDGAKKGLEIIRGILSDPRHA